ncbi:MAG: preprotein translocase subunit SecE [Armatimonadota bacterium]
MAINNDDAVNMTASMVDKPESQQPTGEIRRGMWQNLGVFLRDVRTELRKTDWPSRDELTKFTVVVLVTIFAVAVYLYASDFIAQQLMHVLGIVRIEDAK